MKYRNAWALPPVTLPTSQPAGYLADQPAGQLASLPTCLPTSSLAGETWPAIWLAQDCHGLHTKRPTKAAQTHGAHTDAQIKAANTNAQTQPALTDAET